MGRGGDSASSLAHERPSRAASQHSFLQVLLQGLFMRRSSTHGKMRSLLNMWLLNSIDNKRLEGPGSMRRLHGSSASSMDGRSRASLSSQRLRQSSSQRLRQSVSHESVSSLDASGRRPQRAAPQSAPRPATSSAQEAPGETAAPRVRQECRLPSISPTPSTSTTLDADRSQTPSPPSTAASNRYAPAMARAPSTSVLAALASPPKMGACAGSTPPPAQRLASRAPDCAPTTPATAHGAEVHTSASNEAERTSNTETASVPRAAAAPAIDIQASSGSSTAATQGEGAVGATGSAASSVSSGGGGVSEQLADVKKEMMALAKGAETGTKQHWAAASELAPSGKALVSRAAVLEKCGECSCAIDGATFMLNDRAYCCQRHRLVAYHKLEKERLRQRGIGPQPAAEQGGLTASFVAWI